ncbi:MAG: nuclear transport factor 2 family protein [Parvularculaceae bacterium]
MDQIDLLIKKNAELEDRLGKLEDVNAIKRIHFSYGYYIDYCHYDDVVNLFAEDGEVVFLSGVYKGHAGVRRLYCDWIQQLFNQGREGPDDGFLFDHIQMQDVITIADDRKTAKGRFRGILLGGSHDIRKYRPEGVPQQFMESGIYENDYVRENGVWKIKRLDYVLQWQADYETGWAHTDAHLHPAQVLYPEDPLGPDYFTGEKRETWPYRQDMPVHYAHPVIAKTLAKQNKS